MNWTVAILGLAIVVSTVITLWVVWRWRHPKNKVRLGKLATIYLWKQLAVLGSGPMVTALLVWQLWKLDDRRWCSVTNENGFDAASALAKLNACLLVVRDVVSIKDHTIIGLLIILAMVMGLFIVTEFRTKMSLRGPLGTGLDIGGDQPPPTGDATKN